MVTLNVVPKLSASFISHSSLPYFEWAPGVGDGVGSLACYSPWSHKESDTTEQLNCTDSLPYWGIGYLCRTKKKNFIPTLHHTEKVIWDGS